MPKVDSDPYQKLVYTPTESKANIKPKKANDAKANK